MIRTALLTVLVSAGSFASDRSGGYSIVARALVPKASGSSALLVQAEPAGAVLDKLQLKVFSATGRLISVSNLAGSGQRSQTVSGIAMSRGQSVQVQANVRDASVAARTGVCVATAAVLYEPDLAVSIAAPETAQQDTAFAVQVTVRELNGESGASATLALGEAGAQLGSRAISVAAGGAASFTFHPSLATLGMHTLTAALSSFSLPEENDANDSASAAVNIIPPYTLVGTEGGTVTGSCGTVTIPFGALDAPTEIAVRASEIVPPASVGAVSTVCEFDPTQTLFSRPVQISLPLPAGVTQGCVYFSRIDGSGFDAIGGTVSGGSLVADTPHFGFAVIGAQCPTRTVTGVGQITWLSATTRVSEPIDFSAAGVEALIADGSGGYTPIAGTGGQGTFTIDGVPNGEYVLHAGQQYLVTSTNTPDLGSVQGGRPARLRTPVSSPTTVNLTVNGLDSWDNNYQLEFYSTEADDWSFGSDGFVPFPGIPRGSTSATVPIDLSQMDTSPSLIQGSLGDHALIAELSILNSANGYPYQAMTRAAPLPTFDIANGASMNLSVDMSSVALSHSIAVDYRGQSHVAALLADGHPQTQTVCAICGGIAAVLAQAGDAEDGFYDANADPLILNDYAWRGQNIASGNMTYGAPSDTTLPGSWGLLFDVGWSAHWLPHELAGTGRLGYGFGGGGFADSIHWVTTPEKGASTTLTPVVTLVKSLKVNGVDARTEPANLGTGVLLSWSPPAVGTPNFYTVTVRHFFANANHRTVAPVIANLITPHTSLTIPPGLLQAGEGYVFNVGATVATGSTAAALLEAAPFRSSIDVASSSTATGVVWTGAAKPYAGFAQSKWVASHQNFPWGLAANSSAVYWAERHDSPWDGSSDSGKGNIWTAALDGSDPHLIVSGQHEPEGIAADDSAVYWTNRGDGTIRRYDLGTHAVTTIASGQGSSIGTGIVVSNGTVYWLGNGLQKLGPSDTAPVLLTSQGGVNLDTDGTNLYWTDYGGASNGHVWQMPIGGGTPLALASGQNQSWDVHVVGSTVVWSDQDWQLTTPPTINAVPVGGGTALQVASTNNEIMKVFAADAQNAYYVANGTVFSSPLTGGPSTKLANLYGGGNCPEGKMVVKGHNLWWTDTCGQSVQHLTW